MASEIGDARATVLLGRSRARPLSRSAPLCGGCTINLCGTYFCSAGRSLGRPFAGNILVTVVDATITVVRMYIAAIARESIHADRIMLISAVRLRCFFQQGTCFCRHFYLFFFICHALRGDKRILAEGCKQK